jgi:hypothetical protein
MKYYKLTLRYSGEQTGIENLYYDNLSALVEDVWHYGADGFPVVESAIEITKEEYEENQFPF